MRAARIGVTVLVFLIAAEAQAAKVAVVLKGENALAVLDDATWELLGKVPVGEGPHEVATSADGRLAFVSNYGDKDTPGESISVIDLTALKETSRIGLGALRRPHGLVFFGGKLYFTAESAAVLGRVDPAAGTVDWVIGTGQGGSHMLAIDSRSGRLFSANILGGSLSLFDAAEGPGPAMPCHLSVGPQPEGIAVSPDGRYAWLGHRVGGTVSVIDTWTERTVATLPVGNKSAMPIRLAFTADGRHVLVCEPVSGMLVRYDAATRAEVGRVQVGPGACSIAFSEDGRLAYIPLLGLGELAVVDHAEGKVVRRVRVGAVPDGIAVAAPREEPAPLPPATLGIGMEPSPSAEGVLVNRVNPGSPAEAAGLQPGDILQAVEDAPLEHPAALVKLLRRCHPGDVLKFTVGRKGSSVPVKVTLGAMAEQR